MTPAEEMEQSKKLIKEMKAQIKDMKEQIKRSKYSVDNPNSIDQILFEIEYNAKIKRVVLTSYLFFVILIFISFLLGGY